MKKFIFDVDGTLTPSRERIDKEFEEWFLDFCMWHDVYLVTGSDNPKTIEQVGESIGNACKKLYNCSGSDVYEQGKNTKEREAIAKEFERRFPELQAKVGGETGIAIFPLGSDKSQILRDFDPSDELHFFGDAMHPAGNDYPLKKIILDKDLGICYNVKDYEHTWELLKQYD